MKKHHQKVIKNNSTKKEPNSFLRMEYLYNFLILMVIATYLFLLFRFVTIGEILPHDWDESIYYQSSLVFAKYNSLKSSVFIEELVSKIFEADYYGPGYPLFFGSFRKLMGNEEKSFIYTNFILLSVVLWILYKMKSLSITDKKWIALVLLLSTPVLNYIFYFMPCMLDLLFAAILVYILILMQQKKNENFIELIALYCFLTIIISFFKQNFIFFLFGILPYSKNRIQLIFYFTIPFIGVLITKIYASFFSAPVFAESLKVFDYLLQLDFSSTFKVLTKIADENITYLFKIYDNLSAKNISKVDGGPSISYLPSYFILFIVPVLSLIFGYTRKNKLLLALGLVLTITMLSYIFMYFTNYYYLIRITIPLLLLNFIVVVFLDNTIKKIIQISLLVALILMFPAGLKFVKQNQDLKKITYNGVKNIQNNFSSLAKLGNNHEVTTILFDAAFYQQYNTLYFLLSLPLISDNGHRMRYTVNYRFQDRFRLLGKIKVNYILSPNLMNFENATLVEKNQFYNLYKLIN